MGRKSVVSNMIRLLQGMCHIRHEFLEKTLRAYNEELR